APTGLADVGSAHLCLQNTKRESHAHALFPGTSGAGAGGDCAGSAFGRRTQSPGRNCRTAERPVYRRAIAVCVATQWSANVERPGPDAGLDVAPAQNRVKRLSFSGRPPTTPGSQDSGLFFALLRNYPPVLGLCELCAALATFAVKAFDLRHKFLSWRRRRALRHTIRDFRQP